MHQDEACISSFSKVPMLILDKKFSHVTSSARTRPTPKRARPVQIRLAARPHRVVPTRFGPPVLSVPAGRSVIPLLPRDRLSSPKAALLLDVRSGPLLPPREPRPEVRRDELVRLRRRHGERDLPVLLQRRGRRGGERRRRGAGPGSTERAEGDGVRVRLGPVLDRVRRRRVRLWRRKGGGGDGFGRGGGGGRGSGQDEHAAMGEVALVGAAAGGEAIMRGCGRGIGRRRGGPGRVVLGGGGGGRGGDLLLVDVVEVDGTELVASCHPPPKALETTQVQRDRERETHTHTGGSEGEERRKMKKKTTEISKELGGFFREVVALSVGCA